MRKEGIREGCEWAIIYTGSKAKCTPWLAAHGPWLSFCEIIERAI
jgi:hypothetical protein